MEYITAMQKGDKHMEKTNKLPDIDLDQVYEKFEEDTRLNTSKASSVEFLTTTRFVEMGLKESSSILDIGAGTGAYTVYFGDKGHNVTAVEPVKKNLDILRRKAVDKENITAIQGNALELEGFASDTFDVVLCLGPLYSLRNFEEQKKCVEEAYRLCKKGGRIFFAFISNDMVIVDETVNFNADYMFGKKCDPHTFKVTGNSFNFMTVEEMDNLFLKCNMNYSYRFAAEGLSILLEHKIDAMTDLQFSKWLEYHFYCCQKDELIGYSNHIVYVVEK